MGHASRELFIQPGMFAVGEAGQHLRTLLGSCVAIVLWHPGARVGAMCHYLLPSRPPPRGALPPPDGRYGEEAMILMLGALARRHVAVRQCVAHVVGGGNMFPRQQRAGSGLDIGYRNGVMGRELVQRLGLPVQVEDLFGIGHRQVSFDLASGRLSSVQIRPLAVQAGADIVSESSQ